MKSEENIRKLRDNMKKKSQSTEHMADAISKGITPRDIHISLDLLDWILEDEK